MIVANLKSKLCGGKPNLNTPRRDQNEGNVEKKDDLSLKLMCQMEKRLQEQELIISLLQEKTTKSEAVPKRPEQALQTELISENTFPAMVQTRQNKSADGDRKASNQYKIITGTSKPQDETTNCFRAADKRAWFYVGRTSSDTTSKQVHQHLENKFPGSNITVEDLISVDRDKHKQNQTKSFKVGINFNLLEQMQSADVWPENVIVRRYRFFRDNRDKRNNS